MLGIYIHIPFCKSRCRYCDFYSTTRLDAREQYIDALAREFDQRCQAQPRWRQPVRTVYLGGGTPSCLTIDQLRRIVRSLHLSEQPAEMTIELNPGDADIHYLRELRQLGFNRLSMGIQSFSDTLLQLIGRRHTAQQAIEAVRMAQEAGFDNLSIDLIYGLPGQTIEQWQQDIQTALNLKVQHISAYNLIYEPGTVLTGMLEAGKIQPVDEDTEMTMYDLLHDQLTQAGYEHYEVSNFALPGFRSMHNSSYWCGIAYLGLGAGAHSYLPAAGEEPALRSWNTDSLTDYRQESETLSDDDLYNEYIMLGLRTGEGILRSRLRQPELIEPELHNGLLRLHGDQLVATQKGWHILNRIIQKLMI